MRIFIALDIPAEIRQRLAEYIDGVRSCAPEARWARVEGLHVTLKFVGEVSEELVQKIKSALAAVKAAPFQMKFEGIGFFPNPKSPRVFWAGVEGDKELAALAGHIDETLEKLGIAREEKAYHPHLTLARAATHPLRELTPLSDVPAPRFGTMTAREFFLYQSQPQRGGSKYTKLERFGLE
jgi:RNA 2',3'-cyclic 3'-phosphodiesterase